MSPDQPTRVKELADELRGYGYEVIRVPPCTREGGHGRHALRTRTVSCPGVEPIPHGYHSSFGGSFGERVNCLCGQSFADYGDAPTPWSEHLASRSGPPPEGDRP